MQITRHPSFPVAERPFGLGNGLFQNDRSFFGRGGGTWDELCGKTQDDSGISPRKREQELEIQQVRSCSVDER
jgi:hypothetical protein